jgi:hypothetical protein
MGGAAVDRAATVRPGDIGRADGEASAAGRRSACEIVPCKTEVCLSKFRESSSTENGATTVSRLENVFSDASGKRRGILDVVRVGLVASCREVSSLELLKLDSIYIDLKIIELEKSRVGKSIVGVHSKN